MKITVESNNESMNRFETGELYIDDDETIVLCTGLDYNNNLLKGICLSGSDFRMGQYREDWRCGRFVKFSGKITLESE